MNCDNVESAVLVTFRSTWCLKTLAFRGRTCRNLAHFSAATDPGSFKCHYVCLRKYVQHSESNFKAFSDSFSNVKWKKSLLRGSVERRNYKTPEGAEHRQGSFTSGETISEIWRWHSVFLLLWRKCQRQMDGARARDCLRALFFLGFFWSVLSPWHLEWKQIWRPESHLRPPGWEFWHPLLGVTFREKMEKNTLWQKLEVPFILW